MALIGRGNNLRISDVAETVRASGQFHSVTAINTNSQPLTLALLQQYDALLVFTGPAVTGLGDLLADYVDSGGGLVLMCGDATFRTPGGRLDSEGYNALCDAWLGLSRPHDQLGALAQPDHPVLHDVSSFDVGAAPDYGEAVLTPGSRLIASYTSGLPLVAERQLVRGGRLVRRVDINFQPTSGRLSGGYWDVRSDGGRLIANALAYVATPAYLRLTPPAGTVAPGGQLQVLVTLDASQAISGTHTTNLIIASNDPARRSAMRPP